MGEGMEGARAPRRKRHVGHSKAVAAEILLRVAGGEPMSAICSEERLPTHQTVNRWARISKGFGARLARARQAAGWPCATSPGMRFDPVAAAEIYARLCEGEALYRICEDPGLPSHSTVYRWREKHPEFAASLREARAVQAERFGEIGWEIAQAVTPGDAYATHVKLTQLRWTAGCYDPARYGRYRPVESAVGREQAAAETDPGWGARPELVTYSIKRFDGKDEERSRDQGTTYLRNPETGRLTLVTRVSLDGPPPAPGD